MILDEAQNIKNSSSVRWKTLLGFQCRNRLLLTGTPIQNSMQGKYSVCTPQSLLTPQFLPELWALLHFIMPSLFDSHDEFNEWFSKDIENAAENKGGKLNEHQLRRLHMILKPFMLRRVKRHVQNELSEKVRSTTVQNYPHDADLAHLDRERYLRRLECPTASDVQDPPCQGLCGRSIGQSCQHRGCRFCEIFDESRHAVPQGMHLSAHLVLRTAYHLTRI